jgi:spore coat assembly protein
MKLGDYVVRKSYGGDVVFRVQELWSQVAVLKGAQYRLLADAPVDDLESTAEPKLESDTRGIRAFHPNRPHPPEMKRSEKLYFEIPGTVLHLDGDRNYLQKSMSIYNGLQIPAEGYHLREAEMANALVELLPRIQPDIVVITGHDGYVKHRRAIDKQDIQNYKNSKHFVQAVRVARLYERNRDQLTVIAGACQSHFEALLQAGANFASSPERILIHALDPVYIAAKSAFTSVKDTVNIYDVITQTVSGLKGLGGIETKGSFRIGLPRLGAES